MMNVSFLNYFLANLSVAILITAFLIIFLRHSVSKERLLMKQEHECQNAQNCIISFLTDCQLNWALIKKYLGNHDEGMTPLRTKAVDIFLYLSLIHI